MYFRKWNFLTPRLKTSLYFLRKGFSDISRNGTFYISEENFLSSIMIFLYILGNRTFPPQSLKFILFFDKKTALKKFPIFWEIELFSLKLKNLLIFWEMELSYILSKKAFLIVQKKKFLIKLLSKFEKYKIPL